MTIHSRLRKALVLLAAGVVLAAPLGAADVFKARFLTGKGPIEPPIVDVQIEVTSWTTLEEVQRLQQVVSGGDFQAFLNAFNAMDKGVVRFKYARGWNLPIRAAVTVPTEKGKRVMLFMYRENWQSGSVKAHGRNYFMVIDFTLNEKGKGGGRFYEDAMIKLDPVQGRVEMESYGSAPKSFPSVQEVKKAAGK